MELVLAVGLICLLLGLAAGWALRTLNAPRPAPATVLPPATPPQGTEVDTKPPAEPTSAAPDTRMSGGQLEKQLVQALISLHDLTEAASLRTQITEDLARAGVCLIDARAGAGFDPALHRAVDTSTAGAPGDTDTIARQLRPGWITGNTVLRYAEVAVYAAPKTIKTEV
ncbi:nucleotide exchange factor GrpE [Rhodococcus sp. NPDC049939]|uniref:nucleotide exchange factor GrpE n=1 Tax=Rhodococcus sp. NPDC049939 TaxID=3155511 RepID=UPI0033C91EA9